MNLDFTDPRSRTEESFSLIFPEPTFNTKRQSLLENNNLSSHGHINQISKIILRASDPRFDVQSVQSVFDLSGNRKIDIKYSEPVPLNEPMIDREFRMEKGGDFVCVGEGAYIYSAFLDDRKEQSFVRVMALMTQKASKMFIYCHFNDSNNVKPTKSELYELCENHNKYYGGYIYSCEIPNDISKTELKSLLISFTKTGPKINVYLRSVRPPESKLSYLNLYPQSSYLSDISKTSNENVKLNVPFTLGNARHSSTPSKGLPSHQPLSFAICVPPLFGNISLHRLVEFVELSRLLGAQHFIFYNHSVPQEVSNALKHYMKKNIASVLPWSLPAEVDSVWYYGQLLANNDCLYRTMPHFDLVSFNDLDEFIVPHSTASTWGETFSSMLTRDRCGFSFQSAFYDPGIREQFESSLLTPILTAKSEMYSKVGHLPFIVLVIGCCNNVITYGED